MNLSLLLIGSLLLLPAQVEAKSAVSSYVSAALDRTEAGLAQIPGDSTVSLPPSVERTMHWLDIFARSFVQTATMTDEKISMETLSRQSLCMRIDLALLDAKIEELRQKALVAVHEDTKVTNVKALLQLQDLITFLTQSKHAVLSGGIDPAYIDDAWYNHYGFEERPGWCCTQMFGGLCGSESFDNCTGSRNATFYTTLRGCRTGGVCEAPPGAVEEPNVCPFSSSYLPWSTSGYGCGPAAIEQVLPAVQNALRGLSESATKHGEVLRGLLKELEDAAIHAQTRQQLLLGLNPGENPGNELPVPPIREKEGCLSMVCSGNTSVSCRDDRDCENAGRCAMLGVCSRNGAVRCTSDTQCGGGECIGAPPAGTAMQQWRGPLSLLRHELPLITTLRGVFGSWAARQPVESASELYAFTILLPLFQQFEWNQAAFMRSQGETDVPSFVVGSDPMLTMQEVVAPLRKEVTLLHEFSTRGLREFVSNVTMFLRKSCLAHPCRAQLEQAISILSHDSCFADPLTGYEQCKKDVEGDMGGRPTGN